MNYDIIGDVHGHADKLEALLQKLGYQHRFGAWRKAGHTAVFVGDLIDNGPGQLRTLELVRAMVDQQCAFVMMDNHEFNAIAYATLDSQRGAGYYLRPHVQDHNLQHKSFLAAVGHRSAKNTEWIDWFRTIPLWLELDDVRIVHACWHELGPGSQLQQVRDVRLSDDAIPGYSHEHPVFCGHYWLTGTPDRQTAKVACVDYSAGKSGPLVAYRFEGERELSASSFVSSHG